MAQTYDAGFEAGSMAACSAILAFMERRGIAGIDTILRAWNDGSLVETDVKATGKSPPPAILITSEVDGPKFGRKEAMLSGYTGDTCSYCQSIRVKRNGSCLVCEECGQTTGCS